MRLFTKLMLLLFTLVVAGSALAGNGNNGKQVPLNASVKQVQNNVQVNWNPDALVVGRSVIEYHIWRDDCSEPVLAGQAFMGSALDNLSSRTTSYYKVDSATGTVAQCSATVPGLQFGKAYRYWLSVVYTDKASTKRVKYCETQPVLVGQVTVIQPIDRSELGLIGPEWTSPDFGFTWPGRLGADRYIVQVSRDSSFIGECWSSVNRPIACNPALGEIMFFRPEGLKVFIHRWLAYEYNDIILWWRVGYCNSTDSSFDGTLNRYQFTAPSMFEVPQLPSTPF